MSRYHSPAHLFGALLAFALSATLYGQTAPEAAPAPMPTAAQVTGTPPAAKDSDVVVMDKFVASDSDSLSSGTADGSAFGFGKSVAETPRAITVVSDQTLQQLNILKSEDLAKAVPATYTNFRFGLQGTVSIRNQSSDFYFDGMRRIDPQGDFESVWGAYDSLEVVEGPASPIFGLGRIGGYVNFIPKSARAKDSEYITADSGTVSVQFGSFNTVIVKADDEAPLTLFGKKGGFSIFVEDKNTDGYKANGFSRQKLLQAGLSLNVTDNLRLQVGLNYQLSFGGLPGGDNRTDQLTIATNSYWSGGFIYHLDENGDGWLDEKEGRDAYFRGTPQQTIQIGQPGVTPANFSAYATANNSVVSFVPGTTTPSATSPTLFRPSLYFEAGNNDSFFRRIPWQGGSIQPGQGTWTQDGGATQHTGNITMAQLLAGYNDTSPTMVGGQPVQRYGVQMMFYPTTSDNYGISIPGAASGQVPYKAGGVKYAYWLPPPFDIDPYSWKQRRWNRRMSLGEDYYQAQIGAYYLDLINDYNPNYTWKDQVFVDGNNQTKSGSNAYSQTQKPTTFEDKLTFTKKFQPLPWWNVQMLSSVNYWQCWTTHTSNAGDSDIDMRRDLQFSGNGQDSNIETTFTSNDRWYSDTQSSTYVNGLPVGYYMHSSYSETGAGLMFDQSFFNNKIDLVMGARWDYIDAQAYIPPGIMDIGSTSSLSTTYLGVQQTGLGAPSTYIGGTGSYIPYAQTAKGNSNGPSWTVNLTYNGPFDIHPYATIANSTILLNNTGALDWGSLGNVKNSLVGKATLFEVGMKGSIGKYVTYTYAYYNQFRASFDPISTVAGGPSNTISRGNEAKISVQPIKPLTLSVSGNWSLQHFEQGGFVSEPAEAFGFPNVVDPATGAIVIPANAFGYGGRLSSIIPDSDPRFRRVYGIPAAIISTTADYEFGNGLFAGATLFYQSAFAADRLATIWVPKGHTLDLVTGYRSKKWDLTLNITNVLNEHIYNQGAFSLWIDTKFEQAFNITVARHF